MIKYAQTLALCLLLAACSRGQSLGLEDVPTPITSLDDLATAQWMTQNAPPEGFRDSVSFPAIDDNLTSLTNWRYDVFMSFEGVYSGTPRQVAAETRVHVWYNNLGPERRVVIEGKGELLNQEEGVVLEGVRLANDTFLLRDSFCLSETDEAASLVADLGASSLVGGVQRAVPLGHNATINSKRVWRYEFLAEDLILQQIDFGDSGRILDTRGELWVSPEHHVVVRYYVNLEVENAIILLSTSETPLPVDGLIVIRYDLYDIGVNPNITQPFGC